MAALCACRRRRPERLTLKRVGLTTGPDGYRAETSPPAGLWATIYTPESRDAPYGPEDARFWDWVAATVVAAVVIGLVVLGIVAWA